MLQPAGLERELCDPDTAVVYFPEGAEGGLLLRAWRRGSGRAGRSASLGSNFAVGAAVELWCWAAGSSVAGIRSPSLSLSGEVEREEDLIRRKV